MSGFKRASKQHESEGRGCYLKSLKNSRVLVLFKFYEKPSYYVLIIYIKMFETIVVLTYVYSVETVLIPSPGKSFPGFVISH
jgi:hypothetical protein